MFFLLFVPFSFFPNFSSKISPQPLKIETSYLVYRLTTTSCIVGLKMGLLLFVLPFICSFFSSPEHKVLKVSYCDHPVSGVRRQSSVVRRPSCVVNNSFKEHLLLNYWPNFKIISHKCSPEAPLPKLLKWFRFAEQNGRQS